MIRVCWKILKLTTSPQIGMYHILQIKLFMQRSIYNFYSIYSVYLQIKFTVRVTTFYYLHLLINYYYRTLDGDKKKIFQFAPSITQLPVTRVTRVTSVTFQLINKFWGMADRMGEPYDIENWFAHRYRRRTRSIRLFILSFPLSLFPLKLII